MVLRNVAIILLVASLVYMAVRLKGGMLTIFSINYMKTAILAAVFFAMLAGWAYVDFDAFWTTFHKLAFRNDLSRSESGYGFNDQPFPGRILFHHGLSYCRYVCDRIYWIIRSLLSVPETSAA